VSHENGRMHSQSINADLLRISEKYIYICVYLFFLILNNDIFNFFFFVHTDYKAYSAIPLC